ncbi:hypothetical protein [Porphyromonas macacae]|uniref:Poly(3-hydroxybutyrate) depolymerase n=1 Tax=Porphyromonas macacae TaxID=28115 RepID=A0A379DGX1_9PORP|nr:hypothetical protein [Porphyromonas macacae]SUB77596.1 Poly(3-hydroxybutyrate) depolymerase [Porphyromonas macacae]
MKAAYPLYFVSFLCLAFLWQACSDDREPEIQRVPKENYLSDAILIDYFRSQLDKDLTASAPEQTYREIIQPTERKSTEDAMWNLWKKANAERMSKAKWTVSTTSNEVVWQIPQEEKMRIKLFAKGEKPRGGYPMFINLHGGGSYPDAPSAWGSTINEEEWFAALRLSREYKDAPSFYFVPRMSDDRKGRWHFAPQRNAFKRAYQLAVLSEEIDPDRVYLMGISEGGYGSIRLGLFMPDYFAAIGPMAASTKVEGTAVNMRNTAFRMDVGELDYMFGRNYYVYEWLEKMQQLRNENPGDFEHLVKVHLGYGHGIPYHEMSPWLIKYRRRTYPARITYEYYNIDDGYSDGVYYLSFRQLKPETDARILFDVKHRDNHFEVTATPQEGKVAGVLTLYIDRVDFSKPVTVSLNGKRVFDKRLFMNRGTMIEAIAQFGDPRRIFAAKVDVPLQ